MNTNEITIPLGKLVPGKANVRRVNSEAGRRELAASIEAHGLIHNLVTRKAPKGAKFEVVAGGRRLGALRLLLEEGRTVQGTAVTKDYPVRAVLREEGSDTEISLAENDQREPMHPVDEVIAYRDLVEQGMAAEDIAARFGKSVVTVRQRVKLANLSPRILDVMRAGELTLEQAKALAVTDDHSAQEAAWFEQDGWSRNPANLRSFLTSAHVRGNDRLARFVGIEAYEDAGGGLLRDLFAEDGLTFLIDRPLLVKLASERLDAAADTLRPLGWKWAEISLDTTFIHGGGFGRIHAVRRDPTEAEQAELAALGLEYDELAEALDAYPAGNPQIEADEVKLQALESRIEAIQKAAEAFDAQEMALAGCVVGISHGGTLQVMPGLVKAEDRKALAVLQRGNVDEEGNGDGDVAAHEEEVEDTAAGLSAALTEELTAIRTAALRVELSNRPDVALVGILHALVSRVFYDYHARIEPAVEVTGQRRNLAPSIKEPDACRALIGWNEVMEGWAERIPGNPADLWPWLVAQPQEVQLDLLAVVTAANLNAVVARHESSKERIAHADLMAEAVGLNMGLWWTPEAAFLSRLSKADIADVMLEAGCAEDAAKAVERGPKPEGVLEAEKELDGKAWLPAALRMPVSPTGGNPAEAALAAE
ncbi:ParB/RepB/Spo0J family partition protein [Mesorhizobium sp. B3-1-3]|uniref:ParB/RepB/Spo0J family partition protein n=1 Tax=unclassified Mesorhizobium TaxID=325217 RepID=UPI00112E5248|nr:MULTISPECIES: ParB/RepB/Spo0J family partition protein [unclassified Mesorhizobium]TPI54210.1 ParB/RepB/Spo0J family partition protein [Mesorhizobium sp. B3-1-8]TPI61428.1 ParB/RepB/Spo0J family partition protein [Mesorhizobium sp. B3-1-3]